MRIEFRRIELELSRFLAQAGLMYSSNRNKRLNMIGEDKNVYKGRMQSHKRKFCELQEEYYHNKMPSLY